MPLVVASSRLDEKKNHVGLLKAFCASRELRDRANLAIVVRGLEDPLHHYATRPVVAWRSAALAIPSYFTCPGPQTDIPLADLAALYFE